MSSRVCEYIPTLPSVFCCGALPAVFLAGVTLSGHSFRDNYGHYSEISTSVSGHRLVLSEGYLEVISEQDAQDLKTFSEFSLGISSSSENVPGYFFDVLEEEFESILA